MHTQQAPLLTSHKWRELVSSGRLVLECHDVFSLVLRLFYFASFFVSMLSLKPRPLVQSSFDIYAGVPRSDSHTCFFGFFFLSFLFIWRCRFFRVFFPLSPCMDCRLRCTFFPSGWCVFYLVTTGWIFDISCLCENLIDQSINTQPAISVFYSHNTSNNVPT